MALIDTNPAWTSRQRTTNLRSRAGCQKCKVARVKCSEQRPACSRCSRLGLQCAYPIARGAKKDAPLRQLVPAASRGGPLLPPPSFSGLDSTEYLYFDYFRHEVAPRLDGHVEHLGGFWLRIVLREGMRDACVRDAIVGIGALGLARDSQVTAAPLFLPPSSLGGLAPHHHSAVSHYVNAIARFRNRFTLSGLDLEPRSILIITVLLALFELIQGNTEGVSTITSNGLLLLRTKLFSRPRSPSDGLPIAASIDDEAITDAASFLARVATLSQSNGRESRDNTLLLSSYLNEDLAPLAAEYPLNTFISTWFLHLYIITQWRLQVVQRMIRGEPVRTDVQTQKEHAMLTDRMTAWIEAMEDRLLRETRSPYHRALRLSRAAAKHMLLFVAYSLDEDYASWDNSKDTCMEVISVYREFIEDSLSSRFAANVEYGGYITGLSHMARACSDYQVRMEIMAICRKLVGAQWSWDVKGIMMSTSALIEVDESSRHRDGYIPAASRYACTYTSWNNEYTELSVTLTPISDGNNMRTRNLLLYPEDFGLSKS
ncbi:hypothetical protein GQ53DRAFT_508169 [Thozetella sp. PMI_491]|nr:hypothetical protein GQ53DRAFT_508169 [Thozetella sp. PMI_491]